MSNLALLSPTAVDKSTYPPWYNLIHEPESNRVVGKTSGKTDVSDREERAIRANEAKQESAPINIKPIFLFFFSTVRKLVH